MSRKKSGGTFIDREMYTSKAYMALGVDGQYRSKFSVKLLILFLDKRRFEYRKNRKGKKKYVCTNADNITLTYNELKKEYGWIHQTIARAIDELLEKGFIEIVERGGAYQRHKTVYKLSDNWCIWQEGTVFATREKDVKRGFQRSAKKASKKSPVIEFPKRKRKLIKRRKIG